MSFKFLIVSVLFIIGIFSCSNETADLPDGVHRVIVMEKIDAAGYSYLKVNEDNGDYWIAIPQLAVKESDTLYFSQSMTMMNFSSKTLERSFDSILFVEDISFKLIGGSSSAAHPNVKNKRNKKVKIEPLSDGITVAKAYANRESLNGKTVKIKGQVTKFNAEIMDRNWIHIQDGTLDGSNFDLLVTSNDVANLGEVIVVTGTLTIDKDFGSGYKYDVLIEEATIAREQ